MNFMARVLLWLILIDYWRKSMRGRCKQCGHPLGLMTPTWFFSWTFCSKPCRSTYRWTWLRALGAMSLVLLRMAKRSLPLTGYAAFIC
jgi:prepilin signal peptidase PulO-like enzyme (type II secretory pathway)